MVTNPWHALPATEPFVLEIDQPLVNTFNIAPKRTETHKLRLDQLPEPYIGNPKAPVLLLNLNPGYRLGDTPLFAAGEPLEMASRQNLLHSVQEYPFYMLDSHFTTYNGYIWWHKQLSTLIRDTSLHRVVNGIFVVQFLPYHSQNFRGKLEPYLPSQDYTFSLVRAAIEREALIIILRGENLWKEAINELNAYNNTYTMIMTSKSQDVSVLPHKLPAGVYDSIKAAI